MVQYMNWMGGHSDSNGNFLDESFPVEVPGNIQYDLGVHEELGDLNFGTRVNRFLETESWYWTYRTVFQVPQHEKGQQVFFVAEGVDYKCDVIVNGTRILTHEGMFTPKNIPIYGGVMAKGNHIFIPGPLKMRKNPVQEQLVFVPSRWS